MDQKPLRIYSRDDVPRLRYIAGIILGDILGLTWEITTDKRKLRNHPILNYSDENIAGSFRILPHTLLFEKGVTPQEITVSRWNNLPVFFMSAGESDFPFDIFAASFFLISRYEEYLDFQPDEYGRFKASGSIAFRNGFLGIPIIDKWVKEMSRAFIKKYRNFTFRRNEFSALLTIDTDEAFAYPANNIFRSIGGLMTGLKGSKHNISGNYGTVTQLEKDPFDVFDYITENIEKNKLDVRFFFPVGDRSKYDLNPSWKNTGYRKLITNVAARYKTGLHPSYISAGDSKMILIETGRLRTILEKDILFSRFHYLRISMPKSYRDILNAGITEDYSMGYPDEPGFRAGIARPFFFYDLIEDLQTNLKIYPFQVMDGTLYQYKKLDPESSRSLICNIINETKKAGGLFVSIWHNTSLLDDEKWKDWRGVFEFMIKNQTNDSLS